MSDRRHTMVVADRTTTKIRYQTTVRNKLDWFLALVPKPERFIVFETYWQWMEWRRRYKRSLAMSHVTPVVHQRRRSTVTMHPVVAARLKIPPEATPHPAADRKGTSQ